MGNTSPKLCRKDVGIGSVYIPCNRPAVAVFRYLLREDLPTAQGAVCAEHRAELEAHPAIYELVEEVSERKSREQLLVADPKTLTEWERAWRQYFQAHPEVWAVWGHQNGRWPMGHPYRDDSELGV